MPKKLDEIHDAVVRNLKGKINPRTGKPYTEEEMWAIAQEQYKKWKERNKNSDLFFFKASISRIWEENIEILKSTGEVTKEPRTFIEAVVSGLKEDRDGEMMSKEAIEDMIVQFKSGKIGFFPDHGFHEQTGERNVYSWKQMMGVFVDARLEGENLVAVCKLNKAHPDYELFKAYVEEGMPLGFSIGGKPVESPKEVEIEEDTHPTFEKARGDGRGVGGERQGDGGADICKCPNCGYTTKHEKGTPCQETSCPKCGTKMVGVNQKSVVKAKITNFEEKRRQLGMSVEEFYACPRDPPSASALPIFDEAHVRNAMARFNQTHFRNAEEKRKAFRKIVARAKKYGIDTSGFEEKYKS